MLDQLNSKNQSLLLIDSIAVISIVFFHSRDYHYHIFGDFEMSLLRFFGLALFSFSSGYKFMNFHNLELQDKAFLKKYMVKRSKKLYKPYIGYTLLILPILYAVIWIGKKLFSFNYSGMNVFDSPVESLVWKFIIGENPFAYQLWYLVMLLEVTSLCLVIIYIYNINVLFGVGFITGILSLFFSNSFGSVYLYRIVVYGTIFIAGIFFATKISFPEKIALKVLKPLLIVGSYSFYIYLFQYPFLIPIPGRILADILKVHSIFVPIFLTVFTIGASIIIYRFMKAFGINRLFE